MRLISGAWCLSALVLTTAYCSVLTSFIMAPQYKPLVDSVEELADNDKVDLVIQKGLAVDVMIMVVQTIIIFYSCII